MRKWEENSGRGGDLLYVVQKLAAVAIAKHMISEAMHTSKAVAN